ncbi:MAG: DUF2497 domain-containing protein [Rhizobiales bacterium]|nr:DUF2497 domain-containing protein [Hyphomicrobiales bacterium]
MAKLSQAQEPSMEEILASIRRIITEDDSEHAASVPPPAAPNLSTEAIDALFAVRPSEPPLASRPETRAPETRAAVAAAPSSPPPRPTAPLAAAVQPRAPATVRVEPAPSRAEHRSVATPTPASVRHEEPAPARPLLSPGADAAIHAAFGSLSGAAPAAPGSARTLEDITKELLRPMLKAWLDSNLPPLVERLVRDEIERVSRGR